jgi:hypothetical protein
MSLRGVVGSLLIVHDQTDNLAKRTSFGQQLAELSFELEGTKLNVRTDSMELLF